MPALGKDGILGAQDVRVESEEVPEWGGTVYVRSISAEDRDAFEASVNDGKKSNLANLRARLLVRCLCDENGERLFTYSDAAALGKKSGAVLNRLFDRARKLNGMTDSDVQELEGN